MPSALMSDPIPALQSLGYTDREAAFLYLVAAHSGYFLRRQFDYFIDRNKGSIVTNFLKKAGAAGHIEVFDYKQGWRVYHLCSRSIYRLVGDSESQLRRRKGDSQVRARLMALDYVLENETDHYLASEADRVRFFEHIRTISPNLFTDNSGRLQPLLATFPVALADREHPALSLVRFAFIDEGLLSIGKFVRFLGEAEALLRAIGNFEVIYVALSDFSFTLPGMPSVAASLMLHSEVRGYSRMMAIPRPYNVAYHFRRNSPRCSSTTATPQSCEVKRGVPGGFA